MRVNLPDKQPIEELIAPRAPRRGTNAWLAPDLRERREAAEAVLAVLMRVPKVKAKTRVLELVCSRDDERLVEVFRTPALGLVVVATVLEREYLIHPGESIRARTARWSLADVLAAPSSWGPSPKHVPAACNCDRTRKVPLTRIFWELEKPRGAKNRRGVLD